jgi:F0F1-type ATP synthase assembly protein I
VVVVAGNETMTIVLGSDPWNILGFILLGAVLGIIGQGIRIFVGLKKAQDDAEATNKNLSRNQWFDSKQLVTSIIIAFVIGSVIGVLGIFDYLSQSGTITKALTLRDIELIIVAGYAGTDLIEGFITKNNLSS